MVEEETSDGLIHAKRMELQQEVWAAMSSTVVVETLKALLTAPAEGGVHNWFNIFGQTMSVLFHST